ncbi:MAG: hypothetical protein AB7H77_02070 [Bdellovibrionales bacterium]
MTSTLVNRMGLAVTGLCIALTAVLAVPSPAQADDRHGRRYGHDDRDWRRHENQARKWRKSHRHNYYPHVVYAPPVVVTPPPPVIYGPPRPVYYAAPEPSSSVNFIFPLNIH